VESVDRSAEVSFAVVLGVADGGELCSRNVCAVDNGGGHLDRGSFADKDGTLSSASKSNRSINVDILDFAAEPIRFCLSIVEPVE
jgi:hypothetical protein